MYRLTAFPIALCLMLAAQLIPAEGRASAPMSPGYSQSTDQRSLAAPPDICDIVKLVVRDHTSVGFESIHLESRLIEDLGMDALDFIEFIMDMEETFQFEIPDEDAEKIITVGNACDYTIKHLPN
ncbi:acyl carrier protein [Corallococcus sp. H22C18031201]|nr:acyl carrier protein [Corallococcus sp. H22C18031201]